MAKQAFNLGSFGSASFRTNIRALDSFVANELMPKDKQLELARTDKRMSVLHSLGRNSTFPEVIEAVIKRADELADRSDYAYAEKLVKSIKRNPNIIPELSNSAHDVLVKMGMAEDHVEGAIKDLRRSEIM